MKIEAFLPAAITISASIIAAAWCLVQGSTISASASVERDGVSVWGTALSLMGVLIMFGGFLTGLMLLTEQVSQLMMMLLGVLLFLGFALPVSISRTRGNEKSINSSLDTLGVWGMITALVIFLSLFFIIIGGGEGGMIPEAAWSLLMGALTMIGAAFASALCIVSAVKAGSEMLTQRPELSIWSLLFVALGEGIAIYGLIVAILLVSA